MSVARMDCASHLYCTWLIVTVPTLFLLVGAAAAVVGVAVPTVLFVCFILLCFALRSLRGIVSVSVSVFVYVYVYRVVWTKVRVIAFRASLNLCSYLPSYLPQGIH